MKNSIFLGLEGKLSKALAVLLITSFLVPVGIVEAEDGALDSVVNQALDSSAADSTTRDIPALKGDERPEGDRPADPLDSSPTNEAPGREDGRENRKDVGEERPEPTLEELGDPPSQYNFLGQMMIGQENMSDRNPKAEIDPVTGALVYEFPIQIPAGRNGLQPDLSLSYNSQDRENSSMVGLGWSLNIPYIQRLNKVGSEKLYSANYFTSSLSGELVFVSSTTESSTFRAKVESGDFLTYVLSGNKWTVIDKDGNTYKFGHASSTQVYNPAYPSKTFKWVLEEVRDSNDNFVEYEYVKHNNQVFPSKIIYTGNGSSGGPFEIEFELEELDDNVSLYNAGFEIKTKYRISEIRAEIDNQWVRKYTLDYTTTSSGYGSLLASIEESGKDESNNTITLPATEFTYQDSDGDWVDGSSMNFPQAPFVRFQTNEWDNEGVQLVDVNGDGLVDIIDADSGQTFYVYIHTGSGWATSTTWNFPEPLVGGDHDSGTRIVDIDGDGLPEVLRNKGGINRVYKNTGEDWELLSLTLPSRPIIDVTSDGGVRIFDINGDGLVDYVFARHGQPKEVYINTGSGWSIDSNWIIPVSRFSNPGRDVGVRMADFNNDGLVDMTGCEGSNPSGVKVYFNKGDGTWETKVINSGACFVTSSGQADLGFRLTDLNQDGLIDITYRIKHFQTGEPGFSRYNVGYGWTGDVYDIVPEYPYTDHSKGYDLGARLEDLNGDGLTDTIKYQYGGQPQIKLRDAEYSDVLSEIDNGKGAVTEVDYKMTAWNRDGNGDLLNPDLYANTNTVEKITVDDGYDTSSESTYTYEGGRYYYDENNLREKRFAGFSIVTKEDALGNITKTYFHQGTSTDSAHGEYDDHVSKIGRPYRIEQYDDDENLFALTINKWDRTDLGNGSSFVKLAETIDFSYDGDTDHREKAESYTYSTTTGNLIEKVEWGEVSGNDNGTFTDTGTDKYTTTVLYAASSTSPISLPSQETTVDQSLNKVKEAKFYYDNLPNGSIGAGNLTKQEQWKSGSSYIDIEKTYNSYGLVIQEKDPRDKVTTYSYDEFNLYPATTTNPAGHVTTAEYDYSAGKPKRIVDPNGLEFSVVYDGLDRVIEEWQPDIDNPEQSVLKTEYEYIDDEFPTSVIKTDHFTNSLEVPTYTYFDGLGRVVQERKKAEDDNSYVVKKTVYNSIGLKEKETLPYFGVGSDDNTQQPDNNLWIEYEYDPLGRVTMISNAVGETENEYDDWKLTVTDANGETKNLYKDARSNLVKVEEHNTTSTYTTLYEYNGLNNLTKITDALGNVRNFTYDGLSRRLTAEDLHAPADNQFSTWYFTYDDTGNVASTTDGKGQVVNYTYDNINRLLTENYLGQSGTEIEYEYDSCVNGVGRICNILARNVETDYEYDPLGRIISEEELIDSQTYETEYKFDRQGNPLLVIYPDGGEIEYSYNDAGLTESIAKKEPGEISFTNIVTNFDYSPEGKMTVQESGNGFVTTNTYDSDNLYRLKKKSTFQLNENLASTEASYEVMWRERAPQSGELELDQLITQEQTRSDETGAIKLNNPVLIPQKRTTNSDTFLVGYGNDGNKQFKTRIYSSDIYYQDPENGNLKPIETNLKQESSGWSVDNGLYRLNVGETTGDLMTVIKDGLSISLTPKTTSEVTSYSNAIPNYSNRQVTYENSLKEGIDLVITANDHFVIKEIKVDSLEAIVSDFRENYYEIPFKVQSSDAVDILVDGKLLSNAKRIVSSNRAKIFDQQGREMFIESPRAYDSSGENVGFKNSIPIDIVYELRSDGIYITKLIPQEWLEKANYPIYTDAVIGFGAGTGDGMINTYPLPGSWELQHSDVTGRNANYTDDYLAAGSQHYYTDVGWLSIARAYLSFDTSDLFQNEEVPVVTGATLNMYVTSTSVANDDQYAYVNVYEGLQASSTILVNSDIDNCGDAITYPTEGSDKKYINNIEVNEFVTFPLNENGVEWLSTTGYTKLCVREGHDVENISIPNNGSYWASDQMNVATSEATGTSTDPYLEVFWEPAPIAPTNLLTNGATNPTGIMIPQPTFTAVFNDEEPDDFATSYRIQVATSPVFTSPVWDTYKTAMSSSTPVGEYMPGVGYEGDYLSFGGDTYYWRIKMWDSHDKESSWSTTTAQFTTGNANTIQNISYTYDPVGNIIEIEDTGGTSAARTVVYAYDDLHRLLSASTTAVASGPGYKEELTYDAIGNIVTKTGAGGNYLYQGTTTSNYANPHAVTKIRTTNYSYDKNGNMITAGTASSVYDYRNQMTSHTAGATTTSYEYNHSGDRTKYSNGSETTVYPNKYFDISTNASTTVKHIWNGDEVVATITKSNTDPLELSYVHPDHLGSANIITNASGTVTQVLDYLPYGRKRIEEGTDVSQREFTGHYFDEDTDLSYMEARYYNGSLGRFRSLDPAFLTVGSNEFEKKYDRTLEMHLANPQALNSYSYALNSPLRYTDPEGEIVPLIAAAWVAVEVGLSAYDVYSTAKTLNSNASLGEKIGTAGLTVAGFALPGGGYGAVGKQLAKSSNVVFDGLWTATKFKNPAKNALEHAISHGNDFGITSSKEYIQATRNFFREAVDNGFEMKKDASNVIRVFDSKTDRFGSYQLNKNGSITPKTFYKPNPDVHKMGTNQNYWKNQKGKTFKWK